jgi:hypothetical protein
MIEQAEGRLRVTAPMLIANARALLEAGYPLLNSGAAGELLLDLAA